ncbi:MAG: hypothetical protein SVY10_05855, partial [Thermodesulfobacteriota bacterium]|nr:hypothetical protein [Thermodesulfobacteriota bacterium]
MPAVIFSYALILNKKSSFLDGHYLGLMTLLAKNAMLFCECSQVAPMQNVVVLKEERKSLSSLLFSVKYQIPISPLEMECMLRRDMQTLINVNLAGMLY